MSSTTQPPGPECPCGACELQEAKRLLEAALMVIDRNTADDTPWPKVMREGLQFLDQVVPGQPRG